MPKEEKTVDIDTTGPGAEVNIEEEKKEAVEAVEPVVEEVKEEPVKEEKVEEKQESSDKQQEAGSNKAYSLRIRASLIIIPYSKQIFYLF